VITLDTPRAAGAKLGRIVPCSYL